MTNKEELDKAIWNLWDKEESTDIHYKSFKAGAMAMFGLAKEYAEEGAITDDDVEPKEAPAGYRYVMVYTTDDHKEFIAWSTHDDIEGARHDILEVKFYGLMPITILEKTTWYNAGNNKR